MIDFVYALPVVARNRTDVNTKGFETKVKFNTNNFTFDIGYTFLEVDDLNDLDPMFYRPRHKLVSKSTIDIKNVTHSFILKYQSVYSNDHFVYCTCSRGYIVFIY